jgi:hypothetical protein
MAEAPSISLWPPGIGAGPLRTWAHGYATQYGFTSPTQRDPPAAQAFRHALVASATYLEAYNMYRNVRGLPAYAADQWATARTLGLGNLNEVLGPNPLPKHLMDFWNNYEGLLLAREVASKFGASISNDRLAQIVAGEISASIQAPLGKSRFILFNGVDQPPHLNFKDPRLDVNNYDTNRLPNEGWGMGPVYRLEGNVPPAIIQAFPKLYQRSPPAPSPSPQSNPVAPAPNAPSPGLNPPGPPQPSGGRTDLEPASGPRRFAAANAGPSVGLAPDGRQSNEMQQISPAISSGLPQHVIDTGNYLRANGIEITPRTMYVANVLGPQGAVDLFKRTGSTSSDAVPSPDAATGQQMRACARQLRLGPAAPPAAPDFGASVPPAPTGQAGWNNPAAPPQGDVSEDAGLPAYGPAAGQSAGG